MRKRRIAFDAGLGFDDLAPRLGWPTPRRWQIFWYIVRHDSCTVQDIRYGLGISEKIVEQALSALGHAGLIYVVPITRPRVLAYRTVYGAVLCGLWWCEACDAVFLPMPVQHAVRFCPYCGSDAVKQEPVDPQTGYGAGDSR